MQKYVVLDTGAILGGRSLLDPESKYLCPEGVVREAKDKRSAEFLDTYDQFWEVRSAEPEAWRLARERAKVTGDESELSDVDLSVVALAVSVALSEELPLRPLKDVELVLRGEACQGSAYNGAVSDSVALKVVSSDRALRNLCVAFGINAETPGGKAYCGGLITWSYQCSSCKTTVSAKPTACLSCGNTKFVRSAMMAAWDGVKRPVPWDEPARDFSGAAGASRGGARGISSRGGASTRGSPTRGSSFRGSNRR
ncbi:hypothetical protein GNI_003350 [Gregarina niphandrodes]|uniref:Ribonuclease PIN domain-containing protein n=1 Tax=Gregarina niphandrodes TaxID=110365 RepID=A0A023BDJ9_GRENI|nr:hypothetical protein GNI_003350 [Gregarina niphandrodes]EZG89042.1 hypothetical protein GNI_003350 [Gregarina niphandrodes]|eukprot:XP_011128511.1 hypothetical protein GNI_003350 [Gregarina niphandrodes]